MLILHAIETVVPFPLEGHEWKQIQPHDITAMAEKGECLPVSPYIMKLSQVGRYKNWKWCNGEIAESGVPYISLTLL